jgi:hypothetical protein
MSARTTPTNAAEAEEEPAAETAEAAADATTDVAALTMRRLEDQLAWYDRRAKEHQRSYQRLKVAQIVVAAAIPVLAAFGGGVEVAGLLGALIVVVEGLQQLFQFQQNWLRYRGAAQALEAERHLYRASAGPYARARRPAALLAERVEGLLAKELSAWNVDQREASAAASTQQG